MLKDVISFCYELGVVAAEHYQKSTVGLNILLVVVVLLT